MATRFLDGATGTERFKAMIGQRYYFSPSRVSLNYTPAGAAIVPVGNQPQGYSNLLAAATGLILPKTYADVAWDYNYRDGYSDRIAAGVRYQPELAKVISAGYRYTRDPNFDVAQVNQIDITGQWPLTSRLYAVGRYNWSFLGKQTVSDPSPGGQLLEAIAGFEYNAGCWAARVVGQRLAALSGSPNTTLFLQLELTDFGSVGSNPISLLRRSITRLRQDQRVEHFQQPAHDTMTAMHPYLRSLTVLVFILASFFGAPAGAAPADPVEADRIVAVVGDEVITQYDLRQRLATALKQLQKQNTTLPPQDVLERQLLERMVMDRVQMQFARETGLKVDDAQLDQAINKIAANNKLTLQQFKAALEKDGVNYAAFREEIRGELTMVRLREREVESKIIISDGEIDMYLANQASTGSGEEYEIAHILLRAPESASPEHLQKLRLRGEQALKRAKEGASFAELTATFSDAPDALQGGDLGWRQLDRLPQLYAETAARMQPGEVSELLRSSAGFHILKLVAKRGGSGGQVSVQQTHARHILIRVNEVVSETEARRKMENLRERLVNGGDFAELARLYSQDGSAGKGGDLGWVSPGDTVPEFERAMDALKDNEVSPVVQTPFGMHLIQVLERRSRDVSEDRKRAVARQALRERKLDEAYQDWLRQMRDRAYVEIPSRREMMPPRIAVTSGEPAGIGPELLLAAGRLRRAGAAGHSWRP